LHEITTNGAENLNKQNSRIETIVPGPEKFLKKIEQKFPEYFDTVKENFKALVEWENKNLDDQKNLALVHGDFHPENIIINKSNNKVSAIDFTDICVSDYARDIANFIQQFRFMSLGRLSAEKIKHYQDMFLRGYFTARDIKKDKDIEKRIQLYSAWTALRSAIYFLLKSPAEPENANTVLKEAQSIVNQNE